ncbi:MAG: hypothetical protein AB7F67_03965 [Rhodospirillaceae bacterium]
MTADPPDPAGIRAPAGAAGIRAQDIPGVITDPACVARARAVFNAACEAGRTAQSVGHAVELLRTCAEPQLADAARLAAALTRGLTHQLERLEALAKEPEAGGHG